MPVALEALFVFLAASASAAAVGGSGQDPATSPTPGASPSPTPLFRLLPYWYESPRNPSSLPLLRFEDQAEVRSLEMNAAIARFFDPRDEKGNMMRGATPGGAPTRGQMAGYRPQMSPSVDLLGLTFLAAKELRKRLNMRETNKGEARTRFDQLVRM